MDADQIRDLSIEEIETRIEEEEEQLGERGLYIHQKYGFQWDTGRRLNLPYSWYAEVLPDGRLIFVDDGDLYEASLEDLGINWN